MNKKTNNRLIDSIFEKLGEKYDHKLVRTTLLKDIPVDLREELKRLYGAEEFRSRRVFCASIINSMFTEQITEFLMSQNLLEELLKGDKNSERNSVNSNEYSDLYSFLAQKGFIEVIEKPGQMTRGQKAKAGRWKWKERSVLRLLSEHWTEDGVDPDDEFESNCNSSSTMNFEKKEIKQQKVKSSVSTEKTQDHVREFTDEEVKRGWEELDKDPQWKGIFKELYGG